MANKNFSPKLGEIETRLAKGDPYLGGKQPSYEDRETLDEIGNDTPDAEIYPHAFAWYSIISRFKPEIRESWGGLKPKTHSDWKGVLDPEPEKQYDTKFAKSLEEK